MAEKPDYGGATDKDPPFPGEDPTQPELDMWIKVMSDRLKKTDFFYVVRDEVPPLLIGISEPIDVSLLAEQAQPLPTRRTVVGGPHTWPVASRAVAPLLGHLG